MEKREKLKKIIQKKGRSIIGLIGNKVTHSAIVDYRNAMILYACKDFKRKLADKPGSVVDSHSSRMIVTDHLKQPTRTPMAGSQDSSPSALSMSSYLVLLQAGFALPRLLPAARCALTAPFHPYCSKNSGIFLLHFPSICHWHTAQVLPGTLPCGARTFLPATKQIVAQRLSG
ncbi:MAG: hypothetical protein K0R12_999 [Gammaproteobacteria bacterium]|nr:hypothetical protein [Gammaproteobacteria bacterium]